MHIRCSPAGASVMMKAPCGGFEYIPNSINHLSLLASGGGVTPVVQLLRDIIKNPDDKTRVSLLYYAETEADFLFKDELDTYVSQDERLKVFYSIKDGAGETGGHLFRPVARIFRGEGGEVRTSRTGMQVPKIHRAE